jgi:SAM-dependent methyltransferase
MNWQVDFGRTAADYATHRAGFPPSFYVHLARRGIDVAGARLVDLGTGTGTLARGFARRGAQVTGIDPAVPMLEQAQQLAAAEQLHVDFIEGRAEATGIAAGSVDIVTAGQCWHWFDRATAAAECRRILRPGGVLVIGHFDWIPLPGNVVAATEALIKRHNPAWRFDGGYGVHGHWLTDMGTAGFLDIESESYDEWPQYSHAAWRGRVRASAGIAATLNAAAVAAFDAELAALLARDFPTEPLAVHHRIFMACAHKPH